MDYLLADIHDWLGSVYALEVVGAGLFPSVA